MALKFRHINTQQTLNTVKFSADSTNTTYFLYSSPNNQTQGTPNINYKDICFIKPTGQVYTHGKLYNDGNNTDGFTDYLNELYLKVHKNIILTGGSWFKLSTTKKVTPGFVYIYNLGIVYVDNYFLADIPLSQLGEPCIYRYTYNEDYESLPKKDWNYEYSYTEFSNPSSDYHPNFHIEKVCDWNDLKHLYEISINNVSQLRDGLMSKEDKVKLDNHTDGYLDYLHKLCIDNNKNVIILSGGEKYENGINKAFVYINNIGIKSIPAIYSESFTINTDYKIILYTVTGAYWFKSSTYNLNDNEELVCDWSDLARLSNLEVPMATEYQNGLMSAEDKEKLISSQTYTLLNNGTDYIYYWKSGNLVSLDLFISDFQTTKNWTLPEGFRPRKTIYVTISSGLGGSICGNISIGDDGKINIGKSLEKVRCFATFII